MESTLRSMINNIYDLYYEDEDFANSLDLYREKANRMPYEAIEQLVIDIAKEDWAALYMDAKIAAKNYLH